METVPPYRSVKLYLSLWYKRRLNEHQHITSATTHYKISHCVALLYYQNRKTDSKLYTTKSFTNAPIMYISTFLVFTLLARFGVQAYSTDVTPSVLTESFAGLENRACSL
jgi:small neutral amino acid transporter SnatA (MarC family)